MEIWTVSYGSAALKSSYMLVDGGVTEINRYSEFPDLGESASSMEVMVRIDESWFSRNAHITADTAPTFAAIFPVITVHDNRRSLTFQMTLHDYATRHSEQIK